MTDPEQDTLPGVEMQDTLDIKTLRNRLWEAADILRGSIDSADYKNYIFGLLFLKRVNDRFDEESEEIADENPVSKKQARSSRTTRTGASGCGSTATS